MAIINRISRLFKADFHAVLDHMEEPDTLLRQAVREMEDALLESEQSIKCMQLEQTRLLGRQSDIEESLVRMQDEIEMCFATDNEALARNLVKRKLEAQLFLKTLLRNREALEKKLNEACQLMKENQSKYEAMRQKSELLSEENKMSKSITGGLMQRFGNGVEVATEEVDIAFLKEKQRFSQSGKGELQ